MNAFLIGGTNSGSGKTTITLALIALLKRSGYSVQPFKVGPDFIDPGYHTLISGNSCINLDSWMLSKNYNIKNFHLNSSQKDIAIIEGVMGLFDGANPKDERGSSAEIAKLLNIPVILIVNAQSMARSVAAIVKGFETFDKDLRVAGVIFNNVTSKNHFAYLNESVKKYCKAEVLGYFSKGELPSVASRHLGLVTADENYDFSKQGDNLADIAGRRINIATLLKITSYKKPPPQSYPKRRVSKRVVVAVAKDTAFLFYYYDNLKILERFGADIQFFSPIKDKDIPKGTSLIYIGGGYPELYAETLSNNHQMLKTLKNFAENYGTIYAECGGFMYLTNGIHDLQGNFHKLVGVFDDESVMFDKLRVLGYSRVNISEDYFVGKKGTTIKGHEFHYSYLKNSGKNLDKIYLVTMRRGSLIKNEGYIYKNCLGSYIHLHFGSNLKFAKNLLQQGKKSFQIMGNLSTSV